MTCLPHAVIVVIFKKFSFRYLNKWDSSIEGREKNIIQEWSERLSGINSTQIRRGLRLWDKAWPPSCDEFRNYCLGKNKNEYGLSYVPPVYRSKYYKSLIESDKEKIKRKQKASTEIKKIREMIL